MKSKLLDNIDKSYIVYKHTAPNNKVYIGISGFDPQYRWLNGRGYKHQSVFFNAIIKYGWINIKHEILFSELTEEEALDKEEELIKQYQSYDRRYGYNVATRGAIVHTKENNKQLKVKECNNLKGSRGREVLKYNKDNELIGTFKSVGAASRDCKLHCETLRGFLNKYKKADFGDFYYIYGERKSFVVQAVSADDKVIKEFKTYAEAYKFLGKTNKGHIFRCANTNSTYCGYKWRVIYEN